MRPLHVAKKFLGGRHSNVEDHSQQGRTPLARAAARGHTTVVRLLLDRGANIEARAKVSVAGRPLRQQSRARWPRSLLLCTASPTSPPREAVARRQQWGSRATRSESRHEGERFAAEPRPLSSGRIHSTARFCTAREQRDGGAAAGPRRRPGGSAARERRRGNAATACQLPMRRRRPVKSAPGG